MKFLGHASLIGKEISIEWTITISSLIGPYLIECGDYLSVCILNSIILVDEVLIGMKILIIQCGFDTQMFLNPSFNSS